MKRFGIILVLLLCAAMAAGLWLVRRANDSRLIEQAQAALEARNYDKAIDLADTYARHTANWRGCFVMGSAFTAQGRYSQARECLQRAAQLKPGAVIYAALAQSYALEAKQKLAPEGQVTLRGATEAVDLLLTAQAVLEKSPQPPDLDLRTAMGLARMWLARACRLKGDLLARSAQVAAAGRDEPARQSLLDQARHCRQFAAGADARALDDLAEVVAQDPSRGEMRRGAGGTLRRRRRRPPSRRRAKGGLLAAAPAAGGGDKAHPGRVADRPRPARPQRQATHRRCDPANQPAAGAGRRGPWANLGG